MRKPLKFAGVPQTLKPSSAASGPKFAVLWGHVEEILLFNKFFSDCRHMPCEDSARQSYAMVPRWRFFCIRRRKKEEEEETTGQKYNDRICYAGRP